jgi:hypothetical protein
VSEFYLNLMDVLYQSELNIRYLVFLDNFAKLLQKVDLCGLTFELFDETSNRYYFFLQILLFEFEESFKSLFMPSLSIVHHYQEKSIDDSPHTEEGKPDKEVRLNRVDIALPDSQRVIEFSMIQLENSKIIARNLSIIVSIR